MIPEEEGSGEEDEDYELLFGKKKGVEETKKLDKIVRSRRMES